MTGFGECTVRHASQCRKQAAVRGEESSKQALFFREQTPILISHITRVDPVHPSQRVIRRKPNPKICEICEICGLKLGILG
jgi:hypothetical protein